MANIYANNDKSSFNFFIDDYNNSNIKKLFEDYKIDSQINEDRKYLKY